MAQSFTPQQLDQLKKQLQMDKQWLERQHQGLDDSLRDQTGELSSNDNHPADIGTELFERGKDIALNENAGRHLREIEEALLRLEEGHYGLCRACGHPIPFERLEALPTAQYCIEHVPATSLHNRPVEEEILRSPFGHTSFDDDLGETEFDGEDAWQIVESWGSSNSPAMAENPNISDDYDAMEIEADEASGYVESFESFLATDLYGQQVSVVRNKAYRQYLRSGEGERLLEPDVDDGSEDHV